MHRCYWIRPASRWSLSLALSPRVDQFKPPVSLDGINSHKNVDLLLFMPKNIGEISKQNGDERGLIPHRLETPRR